MITCLAVTQDNDQIGVSIDHHVRIMARHDQLTLRLSLPDGGDDFEYDLVIQIFFGLIDDERRSVLIE